MISPQFVKTMALYNQWQNQSLYQAADALSEELRKEERGAFFGSIHATLAHILWGDQMWMSRFADTPVPEVATIKESVSMVSDWTDLKRKRVAFDETIIAWSEEVSQSFLDKELSWFSGAAQKQITKPASVLVTHMFNHQTHHRGQVHAMLTQVKAAPYDTDLFLLNVS